MNTHGLSSPKALIAPVLSLTLLCMFPLVATAEPILGWRVTVTNGSDMVVDDFHADFSGTGGSIANEELIMNGAGAGAAEISAEGSQVWVDWGAPGLPVGAMFEFVFTTEFPEVQFDSGNWTIGGVVVGAVDAGDVSLDTRELPAPPRSGIGVPRYSHALGASATPPGSSKGVRLPGRLRAG